MNLKQLCLSAIVLSFHYITLLIGVEQLPFSPTNLLCALLWKPLGSRLTLLLLSIATIDNMLTYPIVDAMYVQLYGEIGIILLFSGSMGLRFFYIFLYRRALKKYLIS